MHIFPHGIKFSHNYPPGKVLLYTNRKAQIHVQAGISHLQDAQDLVRGLGLAQDLVRGLGLAQYLVRPAYEKSLSFLCVLQMRNQFKVNLTPYFLHFVLFWDLNSCKTYQVG